MEDVAGEAFGVHPHEDVLGAVDLAADESDVRLVGQRLTEGDGRELAVVGREADGGAALDELLVAAAVLDEVGDGDHAQLVQLAVGDQVGHPRHRPVLVHDLADDPGRVEAREPGEIDGGLGLADALQHPARAGAEREDVARLDEVFGLRVGGDRHLDRMRAVGGRDAGGHAFARLDRDGERRAERRLVALGHRAQAELLGAVAGEGEANEASCVGRHEVDRVGSCELRCDHEIAFVLAVGVIDDDDEATFSDVFDRGFDRRERGRNCHMDRLALEQTLDVLGENVGLEVDPVAGREVAEGRCGERVRDQGDSEAFGVERSDGEARSLEGDGALLDDVAEDLRRRVDPKPASVSLGIEPPDGAAAVEMALHVVAAERLAGSKRGLEVDARSRREPAERRARERFRDGVERDAPVGDRDGGQAAAVDRDRVAHGEGLRGVRRGDLEAHPGSVAFDGDDLADLANDPGEHSGKASPPRSAPRPPRGKPPTSTLAAGPRSRVQFQ